MGDLTEGFLRYVFGGLIFGGAYTWTGLFSEFYVMSRSHGAASMVEGTQGIGIEFIRRVRN